MNKKISLGAFGLLAFFFPIDIAMPYTAVILISLVTFAFGTLFLSLIRRGSLIYQSSYFKQKSESYLFNAIKYFGAVSMLIGLDFLVGDMFINNHLNLLSFIIFSFGIGLYISDKLEFLNSKKTKTLS